MASGILAEVGRSRLAKFFAACALVARGEDAAEGGKSGEVHVFQKRSVGDQERGAGIFQLIADLALAVGGIEQCGNAAGERGGVISDGELPGVGEEDRDDFSGSESGGNQATGEGFDEAAIFGESEAAIAGGVDQRSFAGVLAATLENDIVNEAASGIGVELGAKHRGVIVMGECGIEESGCIGMRRGAQSGRNWRDRLPPRTRRNTEENRCERSGASLRRNSCSSMRYLKALRPLMKTTGTSSV